MNKTKDHNVKKLSELENMFSQSFALLQSLSEEQKAYIHRQVLISTIGASTRIENAVLTDQEIEWIDTVLTADAKTTSFQQNKSLIENKLSKDKERSIEEVAGCRSMLMLVYSQGKEMFPLTEVSIRGLHYELMQYYKKAEPYWGKYKTASNSVVETNQSSGESREVFKTADPGPVTEAAMSDLVRWYNESIEIEPRSIKVSCELVYRFLAIHPFQDGNGRVGRGLFLLSLLHSPSEVIRTVAPYISFDREIEATRPEYYYVLNKCSHGRYRDDPSEYHTEYFLEYMIKVLEKSLKGIEYYLNRYKNTQDLSPAASKILTCFKEHPEIRQTTGTLIEETGLPRRTVVNGLSTLLRYELIQRYGKGRGVRYQLTF